MGEQKVYLVELPCQTWRSIQALKNAKDATEGSWPRLETIQSGHPIINGKTSVFLTTERLRSIDITEMRDWMKEFVKDKFKMFNRFRYESLSVRVDREYLGVTAHFTSVDDALYFKMFWY